MGTHIRRGRSDDTDAVRALYRAAFPTAAEADLVDRLRESIEPWHAFVAERDGAVVAHVLFTPAELEPAPRHPTQLMALGPMAVHPDHQGQGIGSALGDGALAAISGEDVDAVVVLGHPEWYPRFGFRPARRFDLEPATPAAPGAFMALELVPGVLLNTHGKVRYHNTFNA